MLLYTVVYEGHAMDRDTRLPAPTPDIKYAECTNGAHVRLVVRGGKWVDVRDLPAGEA